jgi:ethanolamine permease
MGRVWGFLCGVCIQLEFVFAPVAIALTVGSYVQVLFPKVPILVSAAVIYVVSLALHLSGAGSSLKFELAFTGIAAVGLIVFVVVGMKDVSISDLNGYLGGGVFPHGFSGLWATLPLAAWFFFGIEALPMATEEARDPHKDIPKALISSFITLAVIGVATLTVAAGVADPKTFGESNAPLPDALANVLSATWITKAVAVFALAALLASFHGIVLAYSRQTFALSRAGYLPHFLSQLNSKKVPTWSLIVPSVIGFIFVVVGDLFMDGNVPVFVNMSVFFAALSYVLMCVSMIILRHTKPNMDRPVHAPGGVVLVGIAAILALLLIPASLVSYPLAFVIGAIILVLYLIYYFAAARHRVEKLTLEEELAVVMAAESEAA